MCTPQRSCNCRLMHTSHACVGCCHSVWSSMLGLLRGLGPGRGGLMEGDCFDWRAWTKEKLANFGSRSRQRKRTEEIMHCCVDSEIVSYKTRYTRLACKACVCLSNKLLPCNCCLHKWKSLNAHCVSREIYTAGRCSWTRSRPLLPVCRTCSTSATTSASKPCWPPQHLTRLEHIMHCCCCCCSSCCACCCC